MSENIDIQRVYFELIQQLEFDEEDLDYSIFDQQLPTLKTLAKIGNSGVSVFDMFKKEHIFYSTNYGEVLGYKELITENFDQQFLDDKIHPEDKIALMRNGISLLKLFSEFSVEEKMNHKLINEYRILNAEDNYVRLIEQHQMLELDKQGNLWLTISLIDISPNQEEYEGVKSQLLNFKTGKIIPFQESEKKTEVKLTKRETEILKLVKGGLLSKEISDRLAISVHTVNTHRQRFLEKLGANNSHEAIILASKLALLD